jgi:hypothetical protein
MIAKQPFVVRLGQVVAIIGVIALITLHQPVSTTAQAESSPAQVTRVPNPAAWSSADRAAPVEPNGVIDTEFEANIGMLDFVVISVRTSGHRCDSVFVARLSANNVHLLCNGGGYTYDFVKTGDEWEVKPD